VLNFVGAFEKMPDVAETLWMTICIIFGQK